MAFKKYKIIDDVAQTYQLSVKREPFLGEIFHRPMPTALKEELDYIMKNYPYSVSEAAIRETIMFPILKEVWKLFDDTLMLWANKSISYNKDLGGVPDYIIAKQSHLGKIVFGTPLLAVVEAKKDDFEGGWAQCLLEMYAIQKINNRPEVPVYGIVSNGDNWEFGQLLQSSFTDNGIVYNIYQPDTLFSILYSFFERCKKNSILI